MGKAAAARKLASAAAYGGGGLSVLGAGLFGVLTVEAKLARKAIGQTNERPPDSTGWYGRGRPGPAVKIALLGDSSAAGYGVDRVEDTPGAHLASGVAAGADRRVYLRHVAVVGAKSSQLDEQVDRIVLMGADVAVILVGANDVTARLLPSQSVRYLGEAVRRLREAGTAVLVGTCPDLGTIRPIAPPLKQVAREWSRRLAAAQAITVVDAGGRTVSLASVLGPEVDAAPALFFGPDRFHPSADGYRSLAGVLIPSTLAALGLVPDEAAAPDTQRGERVMPVAMAAVRAARSPGTELDGTEVGGSQKGLRGRWVRLRHRRRQTSSETTPPDSDEGSESSQGRDDSRRPGSPQG